MRLGMLVYRKVISTGGIAMPVSPESDEILFEGPIALEDALFCLDCEVIFTSLTRCPSCNGTAVWPLARWLSPAQVGRAAEAVPVGGLCAAAAVDSKAAA
jgi:hypothetical protein